jgi:hypothetical protein
LSGPGLKGNVPTQYAGQAPQYRAASGEGCVTVRPIGGSLALASLNLTRRDIFPTLTATLTTIAFDDSSWQRFEART